MNRLDMHSMSVREAGIPASTDSVVSGMICDCEDDVHKGVTTRIYQGREGLKYLRNSWQALSDAISDARHIHSYYWYRSYLDNLEPEPDTVYFAVISRDLAPVAILPLRYSMEKVFGRRLRAWKLAARDQMDIGDIIAVPDQQAVDIFGCIVRALRQLDDRPWDVLILQNLLADSLATRFYHLRHVPRGILLQTGASRYLSTDHADIPVNDRLSGHFRRNLRRCNNKLNKMGELSLQQVLSVNEFPAAFERFLEVEASGWKGHDDRGHAISNEARLVGFFRQLGEDFVQSGQCLINLLKLDNQVIAGQFCILINNRIHILKIGFDEHYRNVSAGYVLLGRLIDYCYEQGIREINFITNGKWTDDWHALSRDTLRISIFNTTLKGTLGYVLGRMVSLRRSLSERVPESVKKRVHSLFRK